MAAGSSGWVSGAFITVDSGVPNSLLFQDFRAAPGSTTFNNGQLQGADGGGTTVYESNGSGSDPQITFGGGNLELNTYGNFRSRFSVTGISGATHVWRNPAAGGQNLSITPTTSLAEYQGTIPNPANGVTGFRIDPVANGSGWTSELDYIFVDRGRTVGFKFDHDGDLLSLGDNPPFASTTVLNSSLSGQANPGGGPASDTNIDFGSAFGMVHPGIYKFVEIRMAGFAGDRLDFFYSNTTSGVMRVEFEAASDGNMHTSLIDLSADAGPVP